MRELPKRSKLLVILVLQAEHNTFDVMWLIAEEQLTEHLAN